MGAEFDTEKLKHKEHSIFDANFAFQFLSNLSYDRYCPLLYLFLLQRRAFRFVA